MRMYLKKILKDEDAQALVEYALLLFVLTIVSYAGITLFIEAWQYKFSKLSGRRSGAAGIAPLNKIRE